MNKLIVEGYRQDPRIAPHIKHVDSAADWRARWPDAAEGMAAYTRAIVGDIQNRMLSYLPLAHSFERAWIEWHSFIEAAKQSVVAAHWTGFYAGPLQDFNEVAARGAATERPNVQAMGVIMRSWTFGIVTDLWGDIPYSSALVGDSLVVENRLQPTYDSQESIYNDIFATLGSATSAAWISGACRPARGSSRTSRRISPESRDACRMVSGWISSPCASARWNTSTSRTGSARTQPSAGSTSMASVRFLPWAWGLSRRVTPSISASRFARPQPCTCFSKA